MEPEEQEILNNNEEDYPIAYPTKNIKFRLGMKKDFSHIQDLAKNTFYVAADASILRLGNLVYLHSIICLTQNQYSFLASLNGINNNILYFIVETKSQSDYDYITQGMPQYSIPGKDGRDIILTPDNFDEYINHPNYPHFL